MDQQQATEREQAAIERRAGRLLFENEALLVRVQMLREELARAVAPADK